MGGVREARAPGAHATLSAPAPATPAPLDETLAWTPRIHHELAAKARSFLERGETEIRITLDPPELGKISVKLEIGPGRVAAHLVATNGHAAALLDRDRGDLVRAFEAQGIDDVSVHVGSEPPAREDQDSHARRFADEPGAEDSLHPRTAANTRAPRARRSVVDLIA
jgi:flagellar hook-length control protein FliK